MFTKSTFLLQLFPNFPVSRWFPRLPGGRVERTRGQDGRRRHRKGNWTPSVLAFGVGTGQANAIGHYVICYALHVKSRGKEQLRHGHRRFVMRRASFPSRGLREKRRNDGERAPPRARARAESSDRFSGFHRISWTLSDPISRLMAQRKIIFQKINILKIFVLFI